MLGVRACDGVNRQHMSVVRLPGFLYEQGAFRITTDSESLAMLFATTVHCDLPCCDVPCCAVGFFAQPPCPTACTFLMYMMVAYTD